MIRILEHGYRYSMEARCPKCGCHFQYDWEDVKIIPSYKYFTTYWEQSTFQYVVCPECQEHITIYDYNFNKQGPLKYTWTCEVSNDKNNQKD